MEEIENINETAVNYVTENINVDIDVYDYSEKILD